MDNTKPEATQQPAPQPAPPLGPRRQTHQTEQRDTVRVETQTAEDVPPPTPTQAEADAIKEHALGTPEAPPPEPLADETAQQRTEREERERQQRQQRQQQPGQGGPGYQTR